MKASDTVIRIERSLLSSRMASRLQDLRRPTPSHLSPNAPHTFRYGDDHVADRRRPSHRAPTRILGSNGLGPLTLGRHHRRRDDRRRAPARPFGRREEGRRIPQDEDRILAVHNEPALRTDRKSNFYCGQLDATVPACKCLIQLSLATAAFLLCGCVPGNLPRLQRRSGRAAATSEAGVQIRMEVHRGRRVRCDRQRRA